MNTERKEFGKWFVWIFILMLGAGSILFGLRYFGMIGERLVFENSSQYHEARKTELATFQAQLAEIESRLTTADAQTRSNLEAQAAALRIRINVARSK